MVKKLVFVRHGHAEDGAGKLDFHRQLTNEGLSAAHRAAKWIAGKMLKADIILSSDASRAKNTAEVIADEMGMSDSLEFTNDLYEASVRSMLQIITELDDQIGSAVIVGHNPAISYLADYLSKEPLPGMSPASVVYVEFHLASWKQLDKASAEMCEFYENIY